MNDLNNIPPPEDIDRIESDASTPVIEATLEDAEKPKPVEKVEDLSLAQALGRLLTRPTRTLRALGDASDELEDERTQARLEARARRRLKKNDDDDTTLEQLLRDEADSARRRAARRAADTPATPPAAAFAGVDAGAAAATLQRDYILIPRGDALNFDFSGPAVRMRPLILTLIMIAFWLVGIIGGAAMLAKDRSRTQDDIFPGLWLLILGGIGFAVVTAFNYSTLRLPRLQTPRKVKGAEIEEDATWFERNGIRVILFGASFLMMLGAFTLNARNQFTQIGVILWVGSVIGFVLGFAPGAALRPAALIERFGRFIQSIPALVIAIRITPTFVALAVILFAGFTFRFNDLEAYPPDMTSDHVEKALDAYEISDKGARPVFLANNGGREVAHFYFLALLREVTGLAPDFNLLKIASGIWGLLGILAAFWFGRSFFREEDKQLANLTGLAMAAMIAVSYWHIMLSRLGLRIVLTPLITMLVLIFFVRALRHNRRWDWIISGLLLGISIYCYQAMRMAPVFIVVGFILAVIMRARDWPTVRSYLFNFIALIVISLAVFAPLGRFMIEQPREFWSRTTGRLFGEDTIEVKDPNTGAVITRVANQQDRLDAFRQNISYFGSNMVRSVLMFNWFGDAAWVTGTAPDGYPEMDRLTGALLLLGLGAWLIRMFKRRDPADWLIPLGALIMLFPTALSLAFIVEVPSSTRASGAIPFVYLLCAFAAALILREAWRGLRHPILRVAVFGAAVLAITLMAGQNTYTYFTAAMTEYRNSTLPHAQAGKILRGFMDSTGTPGNAFMVAFPYWWDHRALAINAQDITWNNGVLQDNLQARLLSMMATNSETGGRYRFRTDRQVLFFVNLNDKASIDVLTAFIPNIQFTKISAFNESRDFLIGVAPPVGCEWWGKYMTGMRVPDECLPPGRLP